MPPDTTRPPDARRDHWPENARSWAHLGPPLRPSPDDTRAVEAAMANWRQRDPAAGPRALLLGLTPELAGCRWPARTRLLAIDRNPTVIGMLWPAPGTPAATAAACADWRAMPLAAETVDIAVGDGCHVCARFPDEALAINRELHRVLVPGALLAIRVFLRPDPPESIDDIRRDLEAGAVGSVHALKWRLAAALHRSTTAGVRLADIWRSWDGMRPAAEREAERRGGRRGWQAEELATLDIHRGLETRFYMPTLAEFRAILSEMFAERFCAVGSYELADRCPTFVLEKRRA